MELDQIVQEIRDWLRATKTPASKLGVLSCGNQRAVSRILAGSASLSTLEAVHKYVRDNPATSQKKV